MMSSHIFLTLVDFPPINLTTAGFASTPRRTFSANAAAQQDQLALIRNLERRR
jgi:hypothetical protein